MPPPMIATSYVIGPYYSRARGDKHASIDVSNVSASAAHGRHPQHGRLRVDQLLAHWAEHDLNHLQQIQTTLKALTRR